MKHLSTDAESPFDAGLERRPANHVPLSPLSFLDRTVRVYPSRTAVVYGALRRDWATFAERCRRLASALAAHGIRRGDTVAAMLPNVPEMLECHFAVPMAGAVLNAINTRLDAPAIRFILEHGGARAVVVDREYAAVMGAALAGLEPRPFVVEVEDPAAPGAPLGGAAYEDVLAAGDPAFAPRPPRDEWDAISLNYTSGTTGDPKGVVCHHRGAYLNALSNALTVGLGRDSVYLWTLPMFHCNGWTFPWAVAAVAGTHVCLRKVEPAAIFDAVARERATLLCAAPVVLDDAAARARGGRPRPPRPPLRRVHRRRGAAGRGHRGHGAARLRRDSTLRPHRNLRPGAGRGGPGTTGRRCRLPSGRNLWRARGTPCISSRRRSSATRKAAPRCRPTARRSARSCCAATR